MTDSDYRTLRGFMQKAAYLRGLITSARRSVHMWTGRYDQLEKNGSPLENTKRMLHKAIKRLDMHLKQFEQLKPPIL